VRLSAAGGDRSSGAPCVCLPTHAAAHVSSMFWQPQLPLRATSCNETCFRGMSLPYYTGVMAPWRKQPAYMFILLSLALCRRQRAEITVYTLRNGVVRAEDEEDSLYAAIDLVSDKVRHMHLFGRHHLLRQLQAQACWRT
jgi:Sigma 54 modulation protein / S30EA ribosomal protein